MNSHPYQSTVLSMRSGITSSSKELRGKSRNASSRGSSGDELRNGEFIIITIISMVFVVGIFTIAVNIPTALWWFRELLIPNTLVCDMKEYSFCSHSGCLTNGTRVYLNDCEAI